jgi:hypothetical protein
MGRTDEKAKKSKDKPVPAPRSKGPERKKCKTPRGVKVEKYKNRLLDIVESPHPRKRNNFNHRMAAVAKLARML